MRARYGVSFLRILEEIASIIMTHHTTHSMLSGTRYGVSFIRRYGVSFIRIWEKIASVIMTHHTIHSVLSRMALMFSAKQWGNGHTVYLPNICVGPTLNLTKAPIYSINVAWPTLWLWTLAPLCLLLQAYGNIGAGSWFWKLQIASMNFRFEHMIAMHWTLHTNHAM